MAERESGPLFYTVTNASQLAAVIKTLHGGETVMLRGGDYGSLTMYAKNFASEVKFVSMDSDNPATFSSINASNSSNITFDSINVQVTSVTPYVRGVNLSGSDLKFVNGEVSGLAQPNTGIPNFSAGISVSGSNIVVQNNNIHNFGTGTNVAHADHVTLQGNHYSNIISDAAMFGGDLAHISVIDNYFGRIDPLNANGLHPDQIQFHTGAATRNPHDIIIKGNVIWTDNDDPTSGQTQSIYMARGGHTGDFYFHDVTVSDNIVIGDHANAILMIDVRGLVINNNTIVYNGGIENPHTVLVPKINVLNSTDVQVFNNVANAVNLDANSKVGAVVRDNVIIDMLHPGAPNYIGNLFVNGENKFPNPADLVAMPGGLLDGANGLIGAHVEVASPTDVTALASMHFVQKADGEYQYQFDARHSLGVDGAELNGATYSWSIDGKPVQGGAVLDMQFATAGKHVVTLTVTDSQGRSDTFERELTVRDLHAVHMDFNGNLDDKTGNNSVITINNARYGDGMTDKALLLGNNAGEHIAFGNLDVDLHSNTGLTFAMTLKLDANSGVAKLISDHSNFSIMYDTRTGNLVFATSGQWTKFATDPSLTNGEWHELVITLDAGSIKVYFDGNAVGQLDAPAGFDAVLMNPSMYGYSIGGSPWSNEFHGAIDSVDVYTKAFSADEVSKLEHGQMPEEAPIKLDYDNILVGNERPELLRGTSGRDSIAGEAGNDTIWGQDGDDLLHGGDGDDFLVGAQGHDIMHGDAGNDRLVAGAGNDTVYGGDGKDVINGDLGDDVLVGGAGADNLWGGEGADRFVFAAGDSTKEGMDMIKDFQHGIDKIDLTAFGFKNVVLLDPTTAYMAYNGPASTDQDTLTLSQRYLPWDKTTVLSTQDGSFTVRIASDAPLTTGDFLM